MFSEGVETILPPESNADYFIFPIHDVDVVTVFCIQTGTKWLFGITCIKAPKMSKHISEVPVTVNRTVATFAYLKYSFVSGS